MPITGAIKHPINEFYYGDEYSNTVVQTDKYYLDQTIEGQADSANTYVSGDVYRNTANSRTYGGDDDISVSAILTVGDFVTGDSKSYLTGGDDTITMLENNTDNLYYVVGDVYYTKATVYGGDDVITGFRGEDATGYFSGDAMIATGAGAGYGGDDIIKATNAADFIYGDFRDVSGANRAVCGDDRLVGYGGDDMMYGDVDVTKDGIVRKWGDDIMRGGGGKDTMYGDAGSNAGPSAATGGDDRMFGGFGADTMYGQYGDDLMKGGKGHDMMDGGAGDDILRGGNGNDIIDGGEGADDLAGGRGADTFVFHSLDGDTVRGFRKAQGDQINLADIAEITGFGDLVANHLVDTPGTGSFAISLGGNDYITVYGVDFDDVTADMFLF